MMSPFLRGGGADGNFKFELFKISQNGSIAKPKSVNFESKFSSSHLNQKANIFFLISALASRQSSNQKFLLCNLC